MPLGTPALSSHLYLFSQYRGLLMRCELTPEEQAKADLDAKAKEEADVKAKADADKAKGDDTEGRISELAKANKELKQQLKAIEDAKKAEEDEKAKKKGDFEKLLGDRETELGAERKAKADYEAKVQKYEAHAKKQIEENLKSIADADKKKAAEKMLAGRPIEEQIDLLPEVMKLAGQTAQPTFGAPTPTSTSTPAKTEVAQMKARYEELLKKPQATPQEIRERHTLMVQLQKVWDEEQAKKLAS